MHILSQAARMLLGDRCDELGLPSEGKRSGETLNDHGDVTGEPCRGDGVVDFGAVKTAPKDVHVSGTGVAAGGDFTSRECMPLMHHPNPSVLEERKCPHLGCCGEIDDSGLDIDFAF